MSSVNFDRSLLELSHQTSSLVKTYFEKWVICGSLIDSLYILEEFPTSNARERKESQVRGC